MQSTSLSRCLIRLYHQLPANLTGQLSKSMATASQAKQPFFTERDFPSSWREKESKYLIVGLGNHDHPQTRHSVGMQVVDKLAEYLEAHWTKDQQNCVGFVACTKISDNLEIVLLKPKMPMNVSGTSVAKTAHHFDIDPDHIYLIQDDIDKCLGKVTIKEQGSANGHNGVKSCMDSLRSDLMPRLKIGIDRPQCKDEVKDYVLAEFPRDEQTIVNRVVDTCLVTIADHMAKRTGVELRRAMKLPQTDKKSRTGR